LHAGGNHQNYITANDVRLNGQVSMSPFGNGAPVAHQERWRRDHREHGLGDDVDDLDQRHMNPFFWGQPKKQICPPKSRTPPPLFFSFRFKWIAAKRSAPTDINARMAKQPQNNLEIKWMR